MLDVGSVVAKHLNHKSMSRQETKSGVILSLIYQLDKKIKHFQVQVMSYYLSCSNVSRYFS